MATLRETQQGSLDFPETAEGRQRTELEEALRARGIRPPARYHVTADDRFEPVRQNHPLIAFYARTIRSIASAVQRYVR